MTNEELDQARSTEALRLACEEGVAGSVSIIAARLAREGWMPPVPVDPDIAEAAVFENRYYAHETIETICLQAIKRGRALAAAEAKPGVVWVINRGLSTPDGAPILTRHEDGNFDLMRGSKFSGFGEEITHYAVITPPEEAVA